MQPDGATSKARAAARSSASGRKRPIDGQADARHRSVAARLGQVIQAMEKAVGFDVDARSRPSSRRRSNREDAGNFETFAIGWSGRVDPDGNIYQLRRTRRARRTTAATSNARRRPALEQRAEGGDAEGAHRRSYHARAAAGAQQRPAAHLPLPRGQPLRASRSKVTRRRGLRRRPDPRPVRRLQEVADEYEDDHGRLPPAQGRSRPDRPLRSRACSSSSACARCRAIRRLALGGEDRDPAALAADPRTKYGLDEPLPVQYLQLGRARACTATSARRPARAARSRTRSSTRLPITLELAFLAILIGVADRHRRRACSPPSGAGKAADYAATTVALVGLSVPHFWLGLLMIIFFAVNLQWLPGRRLRAVLARTRSRTSSTCCCRRSCSAPASRRC